MKNLAEFIQDERFNVLEENHKKIILKLDSLLEKEGYIFRGSWRKAVAYSGSQFVFELNYKN